MIWWSYENTSALGSTSRRSVGLPRSPGTAPLLVLRLDNFRDLDFHFVTPIRIQIGETLALVEECTPPVPPAPAVACDPAVFFSGFLRAP
jgi:hypothetical protein